MKINRFKCLAAFLLLAALVALVALPASAQVTPTRITDATTNGVAVTYDSGGVTFAGTTNAWVDIPQGNPLGLTVAVSANGAGTGTNMAVVEVSADGTNALTGPTFSFLYSINGTNTVRYATNFPAADVRNFRKARLKTLTSNSTNTVNTASFYWLRN